MYIFYLKENKSSRNLKKEWDRPFFFLYIFHSPSKFFLLFEYHSILFFSNPVANCCCSFILLQLLLEWQKMVNAGYELKIYPTDTKKNISFFYKYTSLQHFVWVVGCLFFLLDKILMMLGSVIFLYASRFSSRFFGTWIFSTFQYLRNCWYAKMAAMTVEKLKNYKNFNSSVTLWNEILIFQYKSFIVNVR